MVIYFHLHLTRQFAPHRTKRMSSSINRLFGVAKKTVLITGGSRGIGKMLATGYVNAGARVIISSRSEDALLETVESIKSTTENPNPELFHIASNVASREGCEQVRSSES